MPNSSRVQPSKTPSHPTTDAYRVSVVLLLVALACFALNACASTPDPAKQASAQEARLVAQEHAEALELVSCARTHGIDLPEPTASNKVSTQGVNLKSQRRKVALSACYQKVVSKAAKVHEAERAKEGKPPSEAAQSSTQNTVAFQREHEQLVEVVACARRHGIDLPEPNSHNQVSARGVNTKGHRRESAMSNCFHKVVNKATAEAQTEQREQEAGPRRLGEEPKAP